MGVDLFSANWCGKSFRTAWTDQGLGLGSDEVCEDRIVYEGCVAGTESCQCKIVCQGGQYVLSGLADLSDAILLRDRCFVDLRTAESRKCDSENDR
jgi:hypothetical protein